MARFGDFWMKNVSVNVLRSTWLNTWLGTVMHQALLNATKNKTKKHCGVALRIMGFIPHCA